MKKCYFDGRPVEPNSKLKGIIGRVARLGLMVGASVTALVGGVGCNQPGLPEPGSVTIAQPPDLVTEPQSSAGAQAGVVMPAVVIASSLPDAVTNIYFNGLPTTPGSTVFSSFPLGETKVTVLAEVSAPNQRGSLGSTNFSVFVVENCQPAPVVPTPPLPTGFTVVTSFRTNALTGEMPMGQLLEGCDGRLYGATYNGGSAGKGTIFAVAKNGSNAITIVSITNEVSQGKQNFAGLTRAQIAVRRSPSNPQAGSEVREALFGAMLQGGTNGKGTLFCVVTNPSTGSYDYRVLHHFGAPAGPGGELDGATPAGLLLRASDGQLYGTATVGGTDDGGTLFRISREGQLYRTVHHFGAGAAGKTPWAGVIEGPDGFLYGTTRAGGTFEAGTVYKVAKDGTAFQVLHHFRSSVGPSGEPADGSSPLAGLVFRDGFLYGATSGAIGAGSKGNFFRLRLSGADFELIYLLDGDSSPFLPRTTLTIGPDNALYGVTTFGAGVLFRLRQPNGTAWILDELRRFNLTSGYPPHGTPIFAADGSLYGTTEFGGPLAAMPDVGPGVIYRWTPPSSAPQGMSGSEEVSSPDSPTASSAEPLNPGGLAAGGSSSSQEITINATEPGANAGRGVALGDDTLVVGIPNRTNASYSGSAFVFERSSNDWVEQARLAPEGPVTVRSFGYSTALSGETVLIGAPSFLQPPTDSAESAYVFARSNGLWRQQARLVATNTLPASFGVSVALHDNTAVVGAPTENQNGLQVGAAYVFVRQGTNWSQQARLLSPTPIAGGHFGSSVAIHGNTAVIGSPLSSGFTAPNLPGAVHVFVRNGANWSFQQKLTGSSQSPADLFGAAVGVFGDTAVVGAPGSLSFDATDRSFGSRHAYVFKRTGNSWTEQQKLTPTGLLAFDLFGCSVAISSNRIAVGAAVDWRFVSNRSGGAFLFEREASAWHEKSRHQPPQIQPNDTFGHGIALSDSTLAVGASTRTNIAAISGSVFVFDIQQPVTPPTLTIMQDQLGLLITWPATANGFVLETTTDLSGSWGPVTPAPTGNSYRPADATITRFYRLRAP